jgi:Holliday junction resolvase RusA-like endonuclease
VPEHPPIIADHFPVSRSVSFTVHGVAASAGSKTLGYNSAGKAFVRESSRKAAPWKRAVAEAAGEAMDGAELLEGALWLGVVFSLPRPKGHYGAKGLRPSAPEYPTVRPDATKLLRAVEDALTGVVWRDDAQVVEQHVCKVYGGAAECAVKVRTL